MNIRPTIRTIVIFGFFTVFFLAGASLNPASAQTCDDAKIVSDIIAQINQSKKLAAQKTHINVVAVNGAVKLQGWTDTQKDYDAVVSIVSRTNCVRAVNVNDFESAPPDSQSRTRSSGGCVGGTKPCGDICIPEGDICN